MSSVDDSESHSLELSMRERVDRAADAFEAAWRAGASPRIESHLEGLAESERALLLRELLATELELRRELGEWPSLAEYETRFPVDLDVLVPAFASRENSPQSPKHPSDTSLRFDLTSTLGFPKSSPPPQRLPAIPGYELIDVLGHGGMGVVYRAREIRLNRICALKMIRSGRLAGARDLGRFLVEAESMARLRHPNVVQVNSFGEWEGLPYLDLEYVDGGSLADALDGTPRPPREAAALIETLARAIHEAHRLGIIHRDLKPGNIMLTADGIPKITDFGLAKALNIGSDLTATEEVLGTPSYIAPEQAGGQAKQAGPAADVYALGAILYELITGRPPFKGTTVQETLEQVRTAEPVAPSRLQPKLPRDLETICLTCLRKEPSRRYESAAALARDIESFRNGESILARPINRSEQLWRWCRRNPAVASLAAALASSVIASTIGTSFAAYRFRQGYHRERELSVKAREASRRAEANLAYARRIVDEMYVEFSTGLSTAIEMESYERALLEKSLAFYESVALPQSRDPRVRIEAAEAALRVAYIRSQLGDTTHSLKAHENALAMLEPLVAGYPEVPEYRRALAEGLGHRGNVRLATGRRDDAREDLQRSLALTEDLVRAHPAVATFRQELARSLANSAGFSSSLGRHAEAESLIARAVRIMQRLVDEAPTNADFRFRLGRFTDSWGSISEKAGRLKDGLNAHEQAVKLLEVLSAEYPRNRNYRYSYASSLSNLGASQRRAGDSSAAEAALQQAGAAFERLVSEHPGLRSFRTDLATTSWSLARLFENTGRASRAETPYRRAVSLLETLVRDNPERVEQWTSLGGCSCNLGNVLRSTRPRPREALAHYDRAVVALHEALHRKPGDETARIFLSETYFGRGWAHDLLNHRAETLADLSRALEFAAGARKPWVLGRRAVTKAVYRDAPGAATDAALAGADPLATAETLRDAARAYALASALCVPDGPPGVDVDAREHYQAEAVKLLGRSWRIDPKGLLGFHKFLKNASDLNPLRARGDFQSLLDAGYPADPFAH